jgi:hypothetical protein
MRRFGAIWVGIQGTQRRSTVKLYRGQRPVGDLLKIKEGQPGLRRMASISTPPTRKRMFFYLMNFAPLQF